jgi:hypothetical protein
VREYIPSIDYSRIDLGYLPDWIDEQFGERLVLLCNGPTGSGHASNFDFGPMLELIPPRCGTKFIFTQTAWTEGVGGKLAASPTEEGRDDIFWTDDLFAGRKRWPESREHGVIDINALSYLSRFCEVIVGRCSGPHVFGNVLPNWLDSRKTLVCFTQDRNGACFVRHPEALGLEMKVRHSPASTPSEGYEVLNAILSR